MISLAATFFGQPVAGERPGREALPAGTVAPVRSFLEALPLRVMRLSSPAG
jgi:hypothetical protein